MCENLDGRYSDFCDFCISWALPVSSPTPQSSGLPLANETTKEVPPSGKATQSLPIPGAGVAIHQL